MQDTILTFLFTDIEGSTRLWEREPARMPLAMARHDALARSAVEERGGRVVKTTGDGVHAVFERPLDALEAALALQRALAEPESTAGLALRVRCGLHAGSVERRDGDYYGTAVNRAARLAAAAHGGQVLLSQAVAERLEGALPARVALRDLGNVRLRDLSRPVRVFQAEHPGLRARFPALRSLEETPNNLPHSLASFVGRERELAELRGLLAGARLVTVTGMGGMGKTRLALQLAAEAADAFADGVWWVELAPLHDGRRVAAALAGVLGVQEEPGAGIEAAIEGHVRDRVLLVVLDNCEHVLEACAALARRLLGAGARLRVLATSREPLRIAGEAAYPVLGLPVPGPLAAEPGAVDAYDAVRLFAERARAASPAFALAPDNAAQVAAICHRLDGIPLAIELAAARVRALPVAEIAVRMKDRFRLLTGGERGVLPRQRTLRALIDWSYELLSAPEQAMLRQLSVFAGGCTLEAVEAVCAAQPGEDAADLLGRLVEKSLVQPEEDRGRYRLLETVREYAQERLEAGGEAAGARARHLAHFLALAEAAQPHLMGPEQARWHARLDEERENLLAAHAASREAAGGAEPGLRLASAMKFYWINRGLLALGHGAIEESLARGGQIGERARLRGLFHAGQLLHLMGRYAEARTRLEEALALARALGHPRGIASVLQPLGMAAIAVGERAFARACLDEALVLAQAEGEKRQLAGALGAMAQLERIEERPQRAHGLYREAVRLLREIGDEEAAAIGLLNLAMVEIGQRRGEAAAAMLLEVLAVAQATGSRPIGQSALEACAGLAGLRGDWGRCAWFYGAAEAQARATRMRRDIADEAFLAPWLGGARSALGPAAFGEAEDAGRAVAFAEALGQAPAWLRAPDAATPPAALPATSR